MPETITLKYSEWSDLNTRLDDLEKNLKEADAIIDKIADDNGMTVICKIIEPQLWPKEGFIDKVRSIRLQKVGEVLKEHDEAYRRFMEELPKEHSLIYQEKIREEFRGKLQAADNKLNSTIDKYEKTIRELLADNAEEVKKIEDNLEHWIGRAKKCEKRREIIGKIKSIFKL